MPKVSYKQARRDHEYLWEIYGPAHDMTGGYVDQDDLKRLLEKPTEATARDCYVRQIEYWFQRGPDDRRDPDDIRAESERVQEIYDRYM